MRYRLSLDRRVNLRVNKMRRIFHVDTQNTRRKLIVHLEELFEISSNYARGKFDHIRDETGKERLLTIAERQNYTKIATYTAQIINSVAKGLDERQIDKDLDTLEAMLKKTAEGKEGAERSGLDAGATKNRVRPAWLCFALLPGKTVWQPPKRQQRRLTQLWQFLPN